MAELTPEQFHAMMTRGMAVEVPEGLAAMLQGMVAKQDESEVVAVGQVRQAEAPEAITPQEFQRQQATAQQVAWDQRNRGVRIQHAQGVVCSALGVLFGEAPLGQAVGDATRDLAEEAVRKALRVMVGALDE